MMDERLGKVHFWGSMVCMNVIFLPMFIQGMAGISRRWWDGGKSYEFAQQFLHLNEWMSWGAWILGLFQIPFIINLFISMWKGRKIANNPWDATTLEWAAPSPPPHGNFATTPHVYRGPYEYSVPGDTSDFTPQDKPPGEKSPGEVSPIMPCFDNTNPTACPVAASTP
jgi:cytochrome c oxidase subunit 1